MDRPEGQRALIDTMVPGRSALEMATHRQTIQVDHDPQAPPSVAVQFSTFMLSLISGVEPRSGGH